MSFYRNKVVLVTGGLGFIGSHLVRRLLQKNDVKEIRIVDSARYGSVENLKDLLADSRLKIFEHNLGSQSSSFLADFCKKGDILFHLAAEKHNQSKDNPLQVFDSNINGTYNVYAAAAMAGVQSIIFSSSLYAYGKYQDFKMSEQMLSEPRTVYGTSKLAGENLLATLAQAHGFRYNTLRYFFIYGPRQFAGGGYKSVIVKNFQRMAAGLEPIIFGDGRQSLDYVFVDDCVDATLLCGESPSNKIYNVASGQTVSVLKLTQLMSEIAKCKKAPLHEPPDWTDGTFRGGDPALIQIEKNWTAKTQLEAGLKITWDWIKSQSTIS